MRAHMVPIHSMAGLEWKGGLLWSCFRPAGELLLGATLSCKVFSSLSPFLSLSCLFSIKSLFLFLLSSFPFSSASFHYRSRITRHGRMNVET